MSAFRKSLFESPYPGRTIVIGMTPSQEFYVQVYWIMGRSVNSRNRIFELENSYVKNTIFDPLKLEDSSLIMYYPIRDIDGVHLVSNGDQTDSLFDDLQ